MQYIAICALNVQRRRGLLNLIVHVVLHLGLAVALRTFGGYQDNTVGTTGTIDSCGSTVLQDIDALDVVSRNIADIADLNTVDNIKGII